MENQNVHVRNWTLVKTLIISFGILSGLLLLSQSYVGAHENETVNPAGNETVTIDATDAAKSSELAVAPKNFQYVIEPSNNMSEIVRRSVTLYDQGNDQVEFTKAQVIFIETNIVQEMGPRLLEINEEFEVPKSLIEKYAALAPGLSEATLALWDRYAATANFELTGITPINVPLVDDGSLDVDYTPPPVTATDTPEKTAETETVAGYWWVIGLLAIIAVVLALRRRPNKK